MSDILKEKYLKQKAVYWPPLPADQTGQPQFGDPVEIKCRWTETNEEFIDRMGRNTVSAAKVMVDRDLDEEGGWLWLGKLVDVQDANDPRLNDEAWEIKRFGKIPDKRAKKFLRWAFL